MTDEDLDDVREVARQVAREAVAERREGDGDAAGDAALTVGDLRRGFGLTRRQALLAGAYLASGASIATALARSASEPAAAASAGGEIHVEDVHVEQLNRDTDDIRVGELSIDGDRITLDSTAPDSASNVRIDAGTFEIYDGASWVDAQAERYTGSAWENAQVERYDGNSWVELYPSPIPASEADAKLAHRWYLSEDSDPFVDQIGSADGTNNGTTQTAGDWVDGAARQGDGTDDHVATSTWGSFGSSTSGEVAMAYSVDTTASSAVVVGTSETGGVWWLLTIGDGPYSQGITAGRPAILARGSNGNNLSVEADTDVDDGNPHRIVMNKTGSGASSVEFYVDGSAVSTTVASAEGYSGYGDFSQPVYFFAENDEGSARGYLGGVLDDICVFDDSLTSSEATSYDSPWT